MNTNDTQYIPRLKKEIIHKSMCHAMFQWQSSVDDLTLEFSNSKPEPLTLGSKPQRHHQYLYYIILEPKLIIQY